MSHGLMVFFSSSVWYTSYSLTLSMTFSDSILGYDKTPHVLQGFPSYKSGFHSLKDKKGVPLTFSSCTANFYFNSATKIGICWRLPDNIKILQRFVAEGWEINIPYLKCYKTIYCLDHQKYEMEDKEKIVFLEKLH